FVEGQLLTVDVELDFLANSRLPGDLVKGPIMPPNRRRRPRYADTAGFIEDTWKANRRLTITPGFRWEYFGTPSSSGHEAVLDANFYPGEGSGYYQRFANGAFMRARAVQGRYRGHVVVPDRNNFAPRVGLAYDLTGDGRTVLRAGAGMSFDGAYPRNVGPLVGRVEFFNV